MILLLNLNVLSVPDPGELCFERAETCHLGGQHQQNSTAWQLQLLPIQTQDWNLARVCRADTQAGHRLLCQHKPTLHAERGSRQLLPAPDGPTLVIRTNHSLNGDGLPLQSQGQAQSVWPPPHPQPGPRSVQQAPRACLPVWPRPPQSAAPPSPPPPRNSSTCSAWMNPLLPPNPQLFGQLPRTAQMLVPTGLHGVMPGARSAVLLWRRLRVIPGTPSRAARGSKSAALLPSQLDVSCSSLHFFALPL